MRTALLCCLVLLLAGCTGDNETSSGAVAGSEDDRMHHMMQNITFVAEAREVQEVFDGSFPISDGEALLGPFSGQFNNPYRTHDVSAMLGLGYNVVQARLVMGGDDFALGLAPGDMGSIWSFAETDDGFDAVVVKDDGMQLVVTFLGSAPADLSDHADGAAYEVEFTVAQDPLRVPSGVAIEVDLPSPGSHVVFTGQDGDVPDVLVFDPDDAFVGLLEGAAEITFTVDQNSTRGAYVFLPKGHGAFYGLQVGTMHEPQDYRAKARVLKQIVEAGDVEAIPSGTGYQDSWNIHAPRQPIQAGLCMWLEGGGANLWATLLDPAEQTVAQVAFNFLVEAARSGCSFTEMGADSLQAGAYAVDYSDQGSHGASVQAWLIYYGR